MRAIRLGSSRIGVGSSWLGWGLGGLEGSGCVVLGSSAGAVVASGGFTWVGVVGRWGLVVIGRPGSSRRGAGGLSL
jgi:hypothetical protein